MLTIKRYTNRKLYDVDARRYITLEEIGQLVRNGEELQVVDYATGADLTTATLVQVLFDEQKRDGSFPPVALLTRLVNRGMQAIASAEVNPPAGFEAELRRRMAKLIDQNQMDADEANRVLEALLAPEVVQSETQVSSTDVQALMAEVERLEKRLAELSAAP